MIHVPAIPRMPSLTLMARNAPKAARIASKASVAPNAPKTVAAPNAAAVRNARMTQPRRGPAGAMLPMGFNPSLPLDGSLLEAGEMRSQFNSLKTLIDDVPAGPPGPQGAQGEPGPQGPQGNYGLQGPAGPSGPQGDQGLQGAQGEPGPQGSPFATAAVDGVNTLNPGEPATVSTSFSGNIVYFTFGIPRGADGAQGPDGAPGAQGEMGPGGPEGPQGPPGEVSTQQLNAAIATTALNPNGIAPFGGGFSNPPTQAELEAFAGYVETLRAALMRN